LEERSAVEGEKPHAVDLKSHGHDRPGLLAVDVHSLLAVAADPSKLCVGEDRNVMPGCCFGLPIEPQARHDAFDGHGHLGSFRFLPCLVDRATNASGVMRACRSSRPSGPCMSAIAHARATAPRRAW